jgi:MFS family permease
MRSFLLFISFQLIFAAVVVGQVAADSSGAQKTDSLYRIKDSVSINLLDSTTLKPTTDTSGKINPGITLQKFNQEVLKAHPYSGFETKPFNSVPENIIKVNGKESLFYLLVGLLLFLAFLRRTFPKYFSDLFRLFFRTTMKQRQIREQLMQTPLPSLLMNGFFVVSTGLYVNFLLQHFELQAVENFWLRFLYCCFGVSVVYFIKFIGLKLSGWLFNMQEAANSYIFIVFVVNKIIGIFLLPFLVLLAFMQGVGYTTALMLSWCGIGILILYRLILTYTAVRNQVKVNPFHFFLYFCAFEIAPLLLIYKALLVFFK